MSTLVVGIYEFCFGNFIVTGAVYIETSTLTLTLIIVNDIIVKSGSSSPRAFGDISIDSNSPKHR